MTSLKLNFYAPTEAWQLVDPETGELVHECRTFAEALATMRAYGQDPVTLPERTISATIRVSREAIEASVHDPVGTHWPPKSHPESPAEAGDSPSVPSEALPPDDAAPLALEPPAPKPVRKKTR